MDFNTRPINIRMGKIVIDGIEVADSVSATGTFTPDTWSGKQLGDYSNSTRWLGYNITVVPPGRRAFPLHNHHANEEMFFVLEGSGELRMGEATYRVRAGDVIACPPGGPETAHQIENTSEAPLRYLAISTMVEPDVIEYPDSDKFLVKGRLPAGDGTRNEPFRFIGRRETSLGYWDGEK